MIIETKFNVGDGVYFNLHGGETVLFGKIKYVYTSSGPKTHVSYKIVTKTEIVPRIFDTDALESCVFLTEEEAINNIPF